MEYCFVATGVELQQAFASCNEAKKAATDAPWADGRVFLHMCSVAAFCGYGDSDAGKEVFFIPA